MKWLRQNSSTLILLLLGIILGRMLFPKTVTVGRIIPTIITKRDTVKVPWKQTIYHTTTDTFNLIVHETIHDTVVVNVTTNKPILWPVIGYTQLKSDTASVRTFELASGRGAVLTVYTPGPLIGLYADSTSAPQMSFGVYPTNHVSTVKKLFYGGLGILLCKALC